MARTSKPLEESDVLVKGVGYKIIYYPRGASRAAFTDRSDELLLAGPAGTGKSLGVLHKIHLVLSKYPEAKAFMARKTRSSMTDSCMATFDRHVLRPPDKVHFHKQDQHYYYPNKSLLAIIGLDNPEKIKSTEWDLGYIQEATECLENDWEMCTSRLRNWTLPYQQLIGDCNPDKPNHWLKRRCDQGLTKLLTSTHKDNPRLWDDSEERWTPEGEQYLAKLDRLTGVRRARLFLGQWAAAEGMIYERWDPAVHIVSRQDLPADWVEWPHYWSIDFGYTHPFVWQDWMESPSGHLYLNRQIYRTKSIVEDLAEYIMDTYKGPTPRAVICDHDAEGRAVFERHTGLLTLAAYKAIQEGIQAVQRRLLPAKHNLPGIMILQDSLLETDQDLAQAGKPTKTEDEFDGYVWDQKISRLTNSKKDELPVDLDNHGMDALRYMVAFIDDLADDPQEQEGLIMFDDEVRISPY